MCVFSDKRQLSCKQLLLYIYIIYNILYIYKVISILYILSAAEKTEY